MTIHFVYAGTPDDYRIQSPYCITRNLYKFLAKRVETKYYTWDSASEINVEPNDVVLGHPHYDTNTTIQRFFRSNKPCKARCIIHPLHHGRPQDNMPFDHLARAASWIFSIMGPYWYDTLDNSQFAHWKSKITRVDMAVDTSHYPYLRKQFNPPGQRKLIYIGSSMPQKNLNYMTEILRHLPDVQLKWYGGYGEHPLAKLPNVQVIGWMDLNSAFNDIVSHDIFINTSCSDANATTQLEMAALGVIPMATQESGYWVGERIIGQIQLGEIRLNDLNFSVQSIRNMLNAPDEKLLEIATYNLKTVTDHYNWDVFCTTIWNKLSQLL